MEEKVLNEGLARRFLLGQLPPEEQGRIEETAFENPDSFAFLQAAQDDLVDEFICDELSPDEKERFQNYFLVQAGRPQNQDLRIARALQQYLDREEGVRDHSDNVIVVRRRMSFSEWFRSHRLAQALVIVSLILAAAVGLLLVSRALRQRNNELQTQQQQSPVRPEPTPGLSPLPNSTQSSPSSAHKDIQNTPAQRRTSAPPIVAILLAPGEPTRAEGEAKTISLPSGPIRLELSVIDNTRFQSYQAILQTEGQTVRQWSNLQLKELQAGPGININIPPGLLEKSKHYRVMLKGVPANGKVESVHNYYFKVAN